MKIKMLGKFKDTKNKVKEKDYLTLNASENILGRPGHQDLEGSHWSCYNITWNPNPSAQGCPII